MYIYACVLNLKDKETTPSDFGLGNVSELFIMHSQHFYILSSYYFIRDHRLPWMRQAFVVRFTIFTLNF